MNRITDLLTSSGTFFPAPTAAPRPIPAVRVLRTTIRTGHLIAFGTLYGGHIYGVPAADLHPALLATIGTGAAFMALELYRTPLWLVQVRGLATVLKIVLVVAVSVFWDVRVYLLTAAIIVGGVASHMPGRYRYYSIVHRRPIGGKETG